MQGHGVPLEAEGRHGVFPGRPGEHLLHRVVGERLGFHKSRRRRSGGARRDALQRRQLRRARVVTGGQRAQRDGARGDGRGVFDHLQGGLQPDPGRRHRGAARGKNQFPARAPRVRRRADEHDTIGGVRVVHARVRAQRRRVQAGRGDGGHLLRRARGGQVRARGTGRARAQKNGRAQRWAGGGGARRRARKGGIRRRPPASPRRGRHRARDDGGVFASGEHRDPRDGTVAAEDAAAGRHIRERRRPGAKGAGGREGGGDVVEGEDVDGNDDFYIYGRKRDAGARRSRPGGVFGDVDLCPDAGGHAFVRHRTRRTRRRVAFRARSALPLAEQDALELRVDSRATRRRRRSRGVWRRRRRNGAASGVFSWKPVAWARWITSGTSC